MEMRRQHFNAETESAIRESREILSGNTPARRYRSAGELFRELDAEEKVIDREDRSKGKESGEAICI